MVLFITGYSEGQHICSNLHKICPRASLHSFWPGVERQFDTHALSRLFLGDSYTCTCRQVAVLARLASHRDLAGFRLIHRGPTHTRPDAMRTFAKLAQRAALVRTAGAQSRRRTVSALELNRGDVDAGVSSSSRRTEIPVVSAATTLELVSAARCVTAASEGGALLASLFEEDDGT